MYFSILMSRCIARFIYKQRKVKISYIWSGERVVINNNDVARVSFVNDYKDVHISFVFIAGGLVFLWLPTYLFFVRTEKGT